MRQTPSHNVDAAPLGWLFTAMLRKRRAVYWLLPARR
jgi:hypothetical protein